MRHADSGDAHMCVSVHRQVETRHELMILTAMRISRSHQEVMESEMDKGRRVKNAGPPLESRCQELSRTICLA